MCYGHIDNLITWCVREMGHEQSTACSSLVITQIICGGMEDSAGEEQDIERSGECSL